MRIKRGLSIPIILTVPCGSVRVSCMLKRIPRNRRKGETRAGEAAGAMNL